MWFRGSPLFLALTAAWVLGAGAAAAEPAHTPGPLVHIEVRVTGGETLGRLSGSLEGKVAYFPLTEVARLASATWQGSAASGRATLSRRGKSVVLQRDTGRVVVDGRTLALGAPVRQRGQTWMVPGELLLKALPSLVGSSVEVRAVPAASPPRPRAPVAAVSLPPGSGPRGAAPPLTSPEAPTPGPAATATARPVLSGSGTALQTTRGLERSAAAATPAAASRRPPVQLRHRTYPTHTRVVLEGQAPLEPQLTETDGALVVWLPKHAAPGPRGPRRVRDGLVEALELFETGEQAALRVTFERLPASRKVFRLHGPPRLVLDFYRAAAVAERAPAAPPRVKTAGLTPVPPPQEPLPTPARRVPLASASEPERGAAGAPPTPTQAAPVADPDATAVKTGPLELRYRSYPTYTRVVVESGAPLEPRLVESESALVVALAKHTGPAPRATRTLRDGLVAGLELTESRGQIALRVTFERPPATRKVMRLKDPPRLVLDFYRTPPAPAPRASEAVALRTIVIDPGHGGHDTGAVGAAGLREKDVALDLARRVAALVEEDLGVKAVLTRTKDQFIPLRERTAFANRQKANLFVSIHVNAAPRNTATGTETYFLSSEATDNAARAAAAFENKVIALEGPVGRGARDTLRSILWELAQSTFQQESSRLAEAIQDSLERALRQTSRGVKQAPFYVLGGAAMPAVLVEVGFVSNPQEEQRLGDDGYRDRLAHAIAAGLGTYKHRHDKGGVVVQR